jgi:hypothetical protein
MSNKSEPMAWITNNALNALKIGQADLATVSPQETQMFTNALYLHPAPALTAELRAELLEALAIGERAVDHDLAVSILSKDECSDEWRSRYFKIRESITKLTNTG